MGPPMLNTLEINQRKDQNNQHNLQRLLNPSTIAVVGASDRESSIGRSLLENFMHHGYEGSVYPINPKKNDILGYRCYPSLTAVGNPIDLAIIVTRIDLVPQIIKECGTLGIGGAVVISSGGKEAGETGVKIEEKITREARKGNVRIIGPNCLGILNTRLNLNASFGHTLPPKGSVAFVSQSGGVTTAFLDYAKTEEIGCSYIVSIGSMIDVDFGDMIEFLGKDPDTTAVFVYAESLTNPRKLLLIAKKVSKIKPTFLLKVGRTSAGAKAALSHTGALAGDESVQSAALKQAGIIQIETLNDLFDCANMLAKQPVPKSPALAIVTNTGGPGVMAADHLHTLGLEPTQLKPETLNQLNTFLSPFWSHGNPVDILGDATPETFRRAAQVCANASEFDALLLMNTPQAQVPSTERAQALCEAFNDANLPVFSAWIGTQEVAESRKLFRKAGIPTYDSPGRAVRAFAYSYRYTKLKESIKELSTALLIDIKTEDFRAKSIIENAHSHGRTLLTEFESKDIMKSYGIPTTVMERAETAEQAVEHARTIGFPVVLKLDSEAISHKSDAGGVKLDLKNEGDVRGAFSEIIKGAQQYNPKAQISGVTVQPMIHSHGHELIKKKKKDPQFGPIILFGMGGVLTELLKDTAIGFPPLDRGLARQLIQSTKAFELLKGYCYNNPLDFVS